MAMKTRREPCRDRIAGWVIESEFPTQLERDAFRVDGLRNVREASCASFALGGVMTRSVFSVIVVVLVGLASSVQAQDRLHLAPASGVAHGVPRICADVDVASVASGTMVERLDMVNGEGAGRR